MIRKQIETAAHVGRKGRRAAKAIAEPKLVRVTAVAAGVTQADEAVAASPSVTLANSEASSPGASRPKDSTKLGIVLSLLEDPDGASLAKLIEVTGWLPHTTRAALTGLRKRGFRVVLQASIGGRSSVYRIRTDAA